MRLPSWENVVKGYSMLKQRNVSVNSVSGGAAASPLIAPLVFPRGCMKLLNAQTVPEAMNILLSCDALPELVGFEEGTGSL